MAPFAHTPVSSQPYHGPALHFSPPQHIRRASRRANPLSGCFYNVLLVKHAVGDLLHLTGVQHVYFQAKLLHVAELSISTKFVPFHRIQKHASSLIIERFMFSVCTDRNPSSSGGGGKLRLPSPESAFPPVPRGLATCGEPFILWARPNSTVQRCHTSGLLLA